MMKRIGKKETKMVRGGIGRLDYMSNKIRENENGQVRFGRVNLMTKVMDYVIKTNPEKSYEECCEITMEVIDPH